MTAPRLVVDLDKIEHNARTLVDALDRTGIAVTGVTKAALGSPEIGRALLRAGVRGLGDSRIENIARLRAAKVPAPMTLLRSPMASQVDLVVAHADVSLNSEPEILRLLSDAAAAARLSHGIIVMVELGDLREGVMPDDLASVVRTVLELPNLTLRGIGTNLACQSGVAPDAANMAELSALATAIEATFDLILPIVSGGNSSNLDWALGGGDTGRINDLRLGEAVLLGCEPLHRRPLPGLHADAITLVAEVIESKVKPSQPHGTIGETAFGAAPPVAAPPGDGDRRRVIVALGHQDVDPDGLVPPPGVTILGASSDHLVLDPGDATLRVGDEVTFALNYSALVRAMTSPFISRTFRSSPLDGPRDGELPVAG